MAHILDELNRSTARQAGAQPQGPVPLGPEKVPEHQHDYPLPLGSDLADLIRLLQTQSAWVQSPMLVPGALGTLGYVETTTQQGPFTVLADMAGLTLTVTVGSGRRVRVTGLVPFQSTVGGDLAGLRIVEGATILQSVRVTLSVLFNFTAIAIVVLTPSTGTHTYKLQAERVSGSGSLMAMNGSLATFPGFIHVEDIGT